MAQIKINKLLKRWIKTALKIKNKLLKIKIAHAKKKSEFILNTEKGFFNILIKTFNISNLDALQYFLKDFSKLRAILLIIQDEVFLYHEKFLIWCLNSEDQYYVILTFNLNDIDVRVLHANINNIKQ